MLGFFVFILFVITSSCICCSYILRDDKALFKKVTQDGLVARNTKQQSPNTLWLQDISSETNSYFPKAETPFKFSYSQLECSHQLELTAYKRGSLLYDKQDDTV